MVSLVGGCFPSATGLSRLWDHSLRGLDLELIDMIAGYDAICVESDSRLGLASVLEAGVDVSPR